MNKPVAERGPNVIREMAQPDRMMISGVRQDVLVKAADAIAFSDIAQVLKCCDAVPQRTGNIGREEVWP